jgi:hypothetical protein
VVSTLVPKFKLRLAKIAAVSPDFFVPARNMRGFVNCVPQQRTANANDSTAREYPLLPKRKQRVLQILLGLPGP